MCWSVGQLVVNLVGIVASASAVLALRRRPASLANRVPTWEMREARRAVVSQFSRPCNAAVAWFRQRLRGDYVRWPVEGGRQGCRVNTLRLRVLTDRVSLDRSCPFKFRLWG